MQPLGVGIIGCGNISTTYLDLAPGFRSFEVHAVADLDMDVAEKRAAQYDIRAETVDRLLDADDIDIVLNLTVPKAHFDVTKRILKAKKHAFTEKPLVLSVAEGLHLKDLVEASGLRIGAAPDTFLGGAHQRARAAVDEGAIGHISSGTAHIMGKGMEAWHPNPAFFFEPGGGPMLDMGPYYVTALLNLLGPVKRVVAAANSAKASRVIGSGPKAGQSIEVATPTTLHAILEFASGAIVTLGASWDVQSHSHAHIELYGETGTLRLPDPNFFGGQIEMEGVADLAGATHAPMHPFELPNQKDRANYRGVGLAEMAQAILKNRPHRCHLDLAIHAVDVMTGVLRSAEEHMPIPMTTSCERPEALTAELAQALCAHP